MSARPPTSDATCPSGARCGAAALVVLVVAVACSREGGGPLVTSSADAPVTVRSADGEVLEVHPDGGVMVVTGDCLAAPLVVAHADGTETTVDVPVCPGQELLVTEGSARVVGASPG